ncbi:MAG: tripartite tricarboxylate transporter substrate binding protein [Hyphomonadaceae bacterium]|jgi:tripartite-type tricarboxylate transporter receptor subunit TctC|nr:tripartite tricarboxylate transporter substrate binding protein [Hyphomonadaceae bacterium]
MTCSARHAAFISLSALLVAGSLGSSPAHGQVTYPNQTIKLMVPNPAGGLPDTVARIVGLRLQERMGQSVVIENRPGANARVAVAALLNAPADGYTLLVTDGSILSINPALYSNLAYRSDDVLPVAMLARAPLFLAVHPKVPAATIGEFIAYAKARPGQLNYGSSGLGSTHHLSMEAMNASLKLVMTHVPFKGTGEAMPALLGGHIEVLFSAYPSLSGAADARQVKLLATNSARRSPQAPDLPSLAEFIPGFDFSPVIGIFARAGTPPVVVQKIVTEALAVMHQSDVIRQLAVVGVEPAAAGSKDFGAVLEIEAKRVADVIQAVGIKGR